MPIRMNPHLKLALRVALLVLGVLALSLGALAQEVGFLDLTTVSVRARDQEPKAVHVSLVSGVTTAGATTPPASDLAIEARLVEGGRTGDLTLDIYIKNRTTRTVVSFPWSPHPRDFETIPRADPLAFSSAVFSVKLAAKGGPTLIPAFATLYGSPRIPNSEKRLGAGEWLRLRVRIPKDELVKELSGDESARADRLANLVVSMTSYGQRAVRIEGGYEIWLTRVNEKSTESQPISDTRSNMEW